MATRNKAPFVIFKRKDTKTDRVYLCARFKDEDGVVVKTVTLKAGGKTAATLEAKKLLDDGVVPKNEDSLVLDYLAEFWNLDGMYVGLKRQRKKHISDRYVVESLDVVTRLFARALRGVRMSKIPAAKIEAALSKAGKERGARTANRALQALKVPVAFFCKKHRAYNPIAGIEKLDEDTKERGFFTAAELERIKDLKTESPKAKASVLLGAMCGMRLGEVRALQWADIDFDKLVIHVQHNIPLNTSKVVAPKWSSKRDVPMQETVAVALKLLAEVPGASPLYVFNHAGTDTPLTGKALQAQFYQLLSRIGIDEETRKKRNITYHGLRHYYVSYARSAGIPDFVVQRYAGHKNQATQERYSHAAIVAFDDARAKLDRQLSKKPKKAKAAVSEEGKGTSTGA